MTCPRCRQFNRPERNFCSSCGGTLRESPCEFCGFLNRAEERYCGGCGRPATRPQDVEKRATSDSEGSRTIEAGAERRQLTALFCDLVDSTALSERLDPEELRDVLDEYHEAVTAIIQRFDGYIQSYSGDGLLAYYGYPRAHEDDPQRALRTGLEIIAALPALNARLRGLVPRINEQALAVRIGVHTGPVVVGEMARGAARDLTAIGRTLNVAARVQTLAGANTISISADTYSRVRGYFECENLGAHKLKGLSSPLQIYRVLHENAARDRFELQTTEGLGGIVGRGLELAILKQAWENTCRGAGEALLIRGEGGIGKSRLAAELKHQVVSGGGACVEFRCSSYHQHSPYYPIVDHLTRLMEIRADDEPPIRLQKLEASLQNSGLPIAEAHPLFASLLSLPGSPAYPPPDSTPQRQRARTQELLTEWLEHESKKRPLLTIWEDLHWADPSTLEMQKLLSARVRGARILMIATARPEFEAQNGESVSDAEILLDRLPQDLVRGLVLQLTAGKPLPEIVVEQIVSKTDGVPLFIEELLRMILESGIVRETEQGYELAGPLPPFAIPSTLQDSLMARLDRLSAEKEVVRLGSVIGREFSYELIRSLWPTDVGALERGLETVTRAGVLRQVGAGQHARYIFGHALIQDAAYESLLKSRRQRLHQQVAEMLEQRFPAVVEGQPELLANHYAAAGLVAESVRYWISAAENSAKRSANQEALIQAARGMELLAGLPAGSQRARLELRLQLTLGAPMVATKGYSAPEVKHAFTRAHQLCDELGHHAELFPVLFRLRSFYLVSGELAQAKTIGERLLELASRAEDPGLLLEAHYALGAAMFYLGEFAPAQEQFERMAAIYDPPTHRGHAFIYGQDPGIAALSYQAWALGYLGDARRAEERIKSALALTATVTHTFSQAFVWTFAAMFYQQRNEPELVLSHGARGLEISRQHGFPMWSAMSTMLVGWANAIMGADPEAVAQIERGLHGYRAIGAGLAREHFLATLAQACGAVGEHERALELINEAAIAVDGGGVDNFAAAEIHRLYGELLLASSTRPHDTARFELEKALQIAGKQQARSLELRSAVSLGRLMLDEGRPQPARDLVGPIYELLMNDVDIPDHRAARALLEQLG